MSFLKCKKCVVRACCQNICDSFKEYYEKEYRITIDDDISLKEAKTFIDKIRKTDPIKKFIWTLTKLGLHQTLFIHEQKGE